MTVRIFLTAYDPSDLPGSSVDPLGFERGYLYLADKILPGMTNVAADPRYFSMLCAGSHLAETQSDDSPQTKKAKRVSSIQALERFWALANVMAGRESGIRPGGLRGITYAEAQIEQLQKNAAKRATADFKLLSRQGPYGVIGIYSVVAANCDLLYRETLELRSDGLRLAEAFLAETNFPKEVRRALKDGSDVSLRTLIEWGGSGFIQGKTGPREAACIAEMIGLDPKRSAFMRLLRSVPARESETELVRLNRVAQVLKKNSNPDLWESTVAAILYERCYRLSLLALERILWLCRNRCEPDGILNIKTFVDDAVTALVCKELPPATARLIAHVDDSDTDWFAKDPETLREVLRFLETAAAAAHSGEALLDAVLRRHEEVQRGKFERGRRKGPWVQRDGDRIRLAMTRVGGQQGETTRPDQLAAHPYRLYAADNWSRAAHRS